jgi:hypothetical protein
LLIAYHGVGKPEQMGVHPLILLAWRAWISLENGYLCDPVTDFHIIPIPDPLEFHQWSVIFQYFVVEYSITMSAISKVIKRIELPREDDSLTHEELYLANYDLLPIPVENRTWGPWTCEITISD